jgi:heme-degrading monooxygenase HmoA
MYLQIVTFTSRLADAEVRRIMEERKAKFLQVPGLLQKHYCRGENPGEYAGVYLWESEDAMRKYRSSDLAKSIPAAYQIEDQPQVQTMQTLFSLRAEEPAGEWVQAEAGG